MRSQATVTVAVADKLVKALLVLSRTVHQALETRAVRAAVEEVLSTSMVQVLRLLGSQGGQTSSQVARHLGVSRPAVSQIIDSMSRLKLVTRRPAQVDRREVILELTRRGQLRFESVRHQQRHILRSAVRTASGAKPDRWNDTLLEIAAALAQADESFERFCLQCTAHTDGSCVLGGGNAECPFIEHCPESPKRQKLPRPKRRKRY